MEIGGELWSVVIHFAVEGRLRVQPRFLTLATFSRVAARASERWEDCFRSANDSRCCRRDATMFRWRMQERPLSILSRSPTWSMQACFGTVRRFAWDGVASNSSRPFCHVTVGSVSFLWLSCSNRSVRHPFVVVWVSFVPDGSFRGNGMVLYRGLDLQGRHALLHDVHGVAVAFPWHGHGPLRGAWRRRDSFVSRRDEGECACPRLDQPRFLPRAARRVPAWTCAPPPSPSHRASLSIALSSLSHLPSGCVSP